MKYLKLAAGAFFGLASFVGLIMNVSRAKDGMDFITSIGAAILLGSISYLLINSALKSE